MHARPAPKPPRAPMAWAVVATFVLGACAPLVRFGDVEPSEEGKRTLVDMEVRPERKQSVPPAELAAVVGDASVGVLATTPLPIVPSSTALDEMTSNVQGNSVPADDALVDEAELATDARRLESIYMARGYFRAKNLGHRVVARGEDRAVVEFDVLENGATTVSEIRFLGACEVREDPDPEKVSRLRALCREGRELIPMRVGDVWTEDAYASGLDVLSRAFRQAGFIHARVIGDNWVSRDRGVAAVWYRIDSGPLVRVTGAPIIEGNVHVSAERIRRRVEITEGAIIDAALLRRIERDVTDLGPFFSVQALAVREDEATLAERVPVKVQVAEAPRWELTVGPSVVTDFLRLDLALPVAFTHRNLFGEVVALQAQARPALVMPNCFTGEACFDRVDFGLDAKLRLQVPSFFEEHLSLLIDSSYKRDPTQDAKSQEIGGSVGLSRRLLDGLTARLGYSVAFLNYFASSALSELDPEDALVVSALRFQTQDFLAWFDFALAFDRRDSPLDTRNGVYASFALNLAGAFSGSEVPYTRLIGDVRGYFTPRFLSWLTLAARLEVGWNFFSSAQGTPKPARFLSGGATSMRGYATDRVGDYVCAEPTPLPLRRYLEDKTGSKDFINNPECGVGSTDRTYIGGNYLIESNFELRFHLRGGVGLVYFVDVGRVWSLEREVSLEDLYVAMGPGFRYDLPVGPIRLDVGFLLGRRRATEFHLSLGQAF